MGKYLRGLLAHISTAFIVFVLARVLNTLLGLRLQDPNSNFNWLFFSVAIIIYISLGNFYYRNLLLKQKIISTVVIVMINIIMEFLIISSSYNYAFMTLLVYSGFNNAFAPLIYDYVHMGRIGTYIIIALIPLLLLIRIPKLKDKR